MALSAALFGGGLIRPGGAAATALGGLPGPARLRDWTGTLEGFGIRPTGSAAHLAFNDWMVEQFAAIGIRLEPEYYSMNRWYVPGETSRSLVVPERVGLTLIAADGSQTVLPLANYIPYSGATGPGGLEAEIVYLPLDPARPDFISELEAAAQTKSVQGKIVAVDLRPAPILYGPALSFSYYAYDPHHTMETNDYRRSWLMTPLVTKPVQQALGKLGAAGMVGLLDLPSDFARGLYAPYDGTVLSLPGVYLDHDGAGLLRSRLAAGASRARLLLDAEVDQGYQVANLVGQIPGQSQELIGLHAHTDGPNAVEDDGPLAVLGLAGRLAGLPLSRRPRTFQILLTTHFAGDAGKLAFIARHESDLVPRIVAWLVFEHLGALDWEQRGSSSYLPTGRDEIATVYVDESAPFIEQAIRMVRDYQLDRHAVDHAGFTPGGAAGTAPLGMNGEGNAFYHADIPTVAYITGPSYLLSAVQVLDKIDFELFHRELVGYARMIDVLGSTPANELRGLTPVKSQVATLTGMH